MRRILRVLAFTLLFSALLAWAVMGANTGWTRNTETRMKLDPITEIEFPVIEEQFVPGVDFLAAAFVGAAVLFGISFAFGRKQKVSDETK